MPAYTRPVNPSGISSWYAHTRRKPPSQEAGVDYYCDMGTPVVAAGDGRVVAVAGDIYAATGRYLTIDLDDGRRVRYLHLSRWVKSAGDRVRQGAVVAYSGASGYGSEFFGAAGMADFPWGDTGGPHVHTTLWPTHAYSFGADAGTLDFELYADPALAGEGSTPFEEDDMFTDADRATLTAVQVALGAGGLAPGNIADADTVLASLRTLRAGGALTPDQNNALMSVYKAVFVGGGDAGSVSIIEALATGGGTDPKALAAALAPLLAENLTALSDADVSRLAVAAADEEDRRERERLG